MPVSLPAGVEPVKTACGPRQPAFAAESRTVRADEVGAAEALLVRLQAADPAAPRKPTPTGTGIEWVSIPGGSFRMGSNMGKYEQPVHTVQVPSFELTKTEVTWKQYNQCVADGGCTPAHTTDKKCRVHTGKKWIDAKLPKGHMGDNQPVVCVTHSQAQSFARWAGGRLPTEAEWEYAAKSAGAPSSRYPWGSAEPSCSLTVMSRGKPQFGCGRLEPWPVCSKPKGNSTQGLCDLSGNVWEWVEDHWQESYRGAPTDGSAQTSGQLRVFRGGGYVHPGDLQGASVRRANYGHTCSFDRGFRVAR